MCSLLPHFCKKDIKYHKIHSLVFWLVSAKNVTKMVKYFENIAINKIFTLRSQICFAYIFWSIMMKQASRLIAKKTELFIIHVRSIVLWFSLVRIRSIKFNIARKETQIYWNRKTRKMCFRFFKFGNTYMSIISIFNIWLWWSTFFIECFDVVT